MASAKAGGVPSKEGKKLLTQVSGLADTFKVRTDALAKALAHENGGAVETHAKYMRDKIVPAMVALRETGDALEMVVPADTWPLPTYREMLFIK